MNKSVFTDNIGNEAIRYGYVHLKESICHLFNAVLHSGTFPKQWADGLIIPLHKKGDRMDVNNFRGIVMSSCVSKLLLKIITKRIDACMTLSGRWSKNQCGFKKDHRTEDNLFLLNTIHDKYVKDMKKEVFIAFIDFSKFFDKINRNLMCYKLLKYDINGSTYNVIKSVYNRTGYRVKIGDDISPTFYGTNGLKQGCCLSPILSSIFQNDLHEIVDVNECHAIQLGSLELNSVSWADDLVLMSSSRQGLQNCLKRLEEYCKKWGLEINESKTKCMVMSNKRGPFEPVYIYDTPIEYVTSLSYLGYNVSRNGNVGSIIQDRILKASRVSHMVLQALSTNRNVSAKLAMTLFDKKIVPILLYGCSTWAIPNTHNLIYLNDQQESGNTRDICRNFLSSLLNRPVPIEYSRRVGRLGVDGTARKILVKLKYYSDKQELLRSSHIDYSISNFAEKELSIEKVQNDFCKKSLNMSKYASNTAIHGELGRFPLSNTARSAIIRYWLRLNAGTKNILLNEAYNMCKRDNMPWFQGVQYLLCENGFGNVWLNPSSVDKDCFHKYFKQRLNDQYVQNWRSKVMHSSRFKILQLVHNDFKMSNYIEKIRNPATREIYTRLRIDMNLLSTSKIHGNQNDAICPLCNDGTETVGHFLFTCSKFNSLRKEKCDRIANYDPQFNNLDEEEKLCYILDTRCPEENLGTCCNFVLSMYSQREKNDIR